MPVLNNVFCQSKEQREISSINWKTRNSLCILGCLVFTPFLTTKLEEWKLRDPFRIEKEIGYAIPKNAQIIKTSASIWSFADGANYSWTISSQESLLSWVQSVGKLEYDRTFRVWKILGDGRDETSYITISADGFVATIETFRP